MLHPNEVVNLERGRAVVHTEDQQKKVMKSPGRQLCTRPGRQPEQDNKFRKEVLKKKDKKETITDYIGNYIKGLTKNNY